MITHSVYVYFDYFSEAEFYVSILNPWTIFPVAKKYKLTFLRPDCSKITP